MRTLSVSKDRLYVIYYLALLVLMFFLMKPNVEIPMSVRIGLFGLTFLPVVFRINFLPFVFLCFYGVSSSSFSVVLPSDAYYYLIIVILAYFFYKKKTLFYNKIVVLYAYFIICSLFHFDITDTFSWLLIVILLSDMIKDEKDLQMLFYGFLIISAFLSILYLLNREEFLVKYGGDITLQRSGWINPNVFGAFIASGGILSVSYLTRFLKFERSKFISFFCYLVVILAFLVLSLNSSRGALFAFLLPSVLMVFTSKIKLWIKILIIIFAIGLFLIMLNNNVFELLFFRLQESNVETGGGRTTIWQLKLDAFLTNSNLLELLFGIGETATSEIGTNRILSTHNDIVTSFIGFGLIGLILFVYFILVYPILKANKSIRFSIGVLLIYVFIELNVLEPFFRGYIIVMMFYFYILKYSLIHRN